MKCIIRLLPAAPVLSVALLAGCGGDPQAGGPPAGGPPPAQVVAIEAERRTVTETLELVGSIAANEQVEIKSEMDGTVKAIHFTEGQRVEEGHLLAELDETKLTASLAEAEANFELSRTTFERSKELLAGRLISQQEYDQAASTYAFNEASLGLRRRQLQDTRIHAPFGGVVGARQLSPGQVISRNSTLTWVVDLDPVKVEMNVPERFLSAVSEGQTIAIEVAAWPGQRFEGRVFFVAPFIDSATRTALVKAEIPNPDMRLKPGMFASLVLNLALRENAIVVPEVAVDTVLPDDRVRLMLVDSESKVQPRVVKVGVRLDGWIEVVDGLEEGEKVIVEGLQKIVPGGPVKLAPPESLVPYRPKTETSTRG